MDPNLSNNGDEPNAETMIYWNDIDFTATLGNPIVALVSTSTSNGSMDLSALPTEILSEIIAQMSPQDKIATAFERPQDFMNLQRTHVFVQDAYRQLNIPTYMAVPGEQRPLLLEAIAHGFSINQIDQILNIYEQVCIIRNIGPDTFLNSDFPSNRPPNVPPPVSGNQARMVYSPLHVAVQHRRIDVVKYLLQRGANTNQKILYPQQTPFQYALTLASRWWHYFHTRDEERTLEFEDIALVLGPFSQSTPFSNNFQRLSFEMFTALSGGLERVSMALLMKFKGANPSLDTIPDEELRLLLQDRRHEMLDDVLRVFPLMPRVLTFLLDDGATCEITTGETVVGEALLAGRLEMAAAALRWQAEEETIDYRSSIKLICELAVHDNNLMVVQRLATELIALEHSLSISSIIAFTMWARREAIQTRQWLINNCPDPTYDTALRHAIALRDVVAMAVIIQHMTDSGQSIDEPLEIYPGLQDIHAKGNWLDTPLTFALAQQNYHAASQLLSLGADPDKIPSNIRHRVRKIRDRLISGTINDPFEFVLKNRLENRGQGPIVTQQATVDALNYVFARLLDDPEYPLPLNVRLVSNDPNMDADDPVNDSEWEQFLDHYDGIIGREEGM
ncbi:hypothetical protein GGR58DRAFT_525321 [Xylaria digitata]|nr:hypothetical protein GGR58DRAFT_525321 [Xylaria digitata]